MAQLSLFDEDLVQEIRKEVTKEFKRIEGEDYDEWLEVVRTEVDYRLSLILKFRKKPNYKASVAFSEKAPMIK